MGAGGWTQQRETTTPTTDRNNNTNTNNNDDNNTTNNRDEWVDHSFSLLQQTEGCSTKREECGETRDRALGAQPNCDPADTFLLSVLSCAREGRRHHLLLLDPTRLLSLLSAKAIAQPKLRLCHPRCLRTGAQGKCLLHRHPLSICQEQQSPMHSRSRRGAGQNGIPSTARKRRAKSSVLKKYQMTGQEGKGVHVTQSSLHFAIESHLVQLQLKKGKSKGGRKRKGTELLAAALGRSSLACRRGWIG